MYIHTYTHTYIYIHIDLSGLGLRVQGTSLHEPRFPRKGNLKVINPMNFREEEAAAARKIVACKEAWVFNNNTASTVFSAEVEDKFFRFRPVSWVTDSEHPCIYLGV